jgi:hypothetical protein
MWRQRFKRRKGKQKHNDEYNIFIAHESQQLLWKALWKEKQCIERLKKSHSDIKRKQYGIFFLQPDTYLSFNFSYG